MPHIRIDYTANLEQAVQDSQLGRQLALCQRVLRALFDVVQRALAPQFAQGRLGCQIDLAGSDDPAKPVVCRRA